MGGLPSVGTGWVSGVDGPLLRHVITGSGPLSVSRLLLSCTDPACVEVSDQATQAPGERPKRGHPSRGLQVSTSSLCFSWGRDLAAALALRFSACVPREGGTSADGWPQARWWLYQSPRAALTGWQIHHGTCHPLLRRRGACDQAAALVGFLG